MKHSEENLRARCNALLIAMLGPDLAPQWWNSRNKAFDMFTPEEKWKTDPMKVYTYLAHQANRS